jgi:hypothetical protein
MLTRAWLFAVVVCAITVGCASVQPRAFFKPLKIDCDGSRICVVDVSVTCPSDPQLNCSVSVGYDLVLLRNKQGNDKITWLLPQGSDFTFPDNGIEVDKDNFTCKPDGKVKFVCSANPGFGVYKYVVNVKGIRKADSLDPWIVNN